MKLSFQKSCRIGRPVEEVYRWHMRPGVLDRLIPPWERVSVRNKTRGANEKSLVELTQRIGPLKFRWELKHESFHENHGFSDVMLRGPFQSWIHRHKMDRLGPAESCLTDEIEFELPYGIGGLRAKWVRGQLDRMFVYRHGLAQADLERSGAYGAVRPLKFLVTGGGGFVGQALIPFLRSQGHQVVLLVRRQPEDGDEIFWNYESDELDLGRISGVDVVIHLAGENVAAGRWTLRRREQIMRSRVAGTTQLVAALGKLRRRPFAFICASATGYYGDGGDEVLDEGCPSGSGFLADVCRHWEGAAMKADDLGIRVALFRTGIVLSPDGGALGKMLPAFCWGLGGNLGHGRQWMSWISRDDLVGAIYHAVLDQRCRGAINAVAPNPVRNSEFTSTLGRVLRRPAILPLPGWLLKILFGRMANETLLASARVLPTRLQAAGYVFRHERLESALRHVLGRERSRQRG